MFVVRIECYSWMLGKLAFVVFIKKKKKREKNSFENIYFKR